MDVSFREPHCGQYDRQIRESAQQALHDFIPFSPLVYEQKAGTIEAPAFTALA